MIPLCLAVAIEFLRAYFAYPVSTSAVREAEEWSQARGGPYTVTLPLVTRLSAVQAVIGWIWPHLRSMEGGLLLCRVVRQYVLHDVDLRALTDGLPMTSAEVDTVAGVRLQGRCIGSDVRSAQDCPSCHWPQIVISSKGCRCRSGIAPSHVWDAGLLELGTAASILACMGSPWG